MCEGVCNFIKFFWRICKLKNVKFIGYYYRIIYMGEFNIVEIERIKKLFVYVCYYDMGKLYYMR